MVSFHRSMCISDQSSILITRLRSHSDLNERITSETRFMREKVRVCVFVSVRERLVGALERGRLRGGGGGEREGESETLDRCLFFLGSVLRPADGQNRRRRKLDWIPAVLRPSGTLAGKPLPVRAPTRGAACHAPCFLLVFPAAALTEDQFPLSPTWELRFSLSAHLTLCPLIADRSPQLFPSDRRSGSSATRARVRATKVDLS